MTEHRLPDDWRHWPDDPWALLGVDRDADRETIRRSYADLIRRYKPEHFPEEFRRIREAYEIAGRFGEMNPGIIAWTTEPSGHDQLASAMSGWRHFWVPEHVREAKTFPEVYALLCDWSRSGADPSSFLTLYWMLRLDAGLDPQRLPVDWILAAFLARVRDARMQSLYHMELLRRSERCVRGDGQALYRALADDSFCLTFGRLRLEAAFDSGCWDFARDELDRMRATLSHDRAAWILFLLEISKRLPWNEDGPGTALSSDCAAELSTAADLHFKLWDEFDEYDELQSLRADWREARHYLDEQGLCRPLLDLIPETCERSVFHWRERLLLAVQAWNASPDAALKALDRLAEFRPLLNRFLELFSQADPEGDSALDEYPSWRLAELLDAIDENQYSSSREALLRECLRDGLCARDVVDRIEGDGRLAYLSGTFRNQLSHDLPLHCVLRARRMFEV